MFSMAEKSRRGREKAKHQIAGAAVDGSVRVIARRPLSGILVDVATSQFKSFTLGSPSLTGVGVIIGLVAGCEARSLNPMGESDTGKVPDSAVRPTLDVSDSHKMINGGDNTLRPVSPLPSDDHRLATFRNGNQGFGWDICRHGLSRAPDGCAACPAPSSGTSYLRYTASAQEPDCVPEPGQVCPLQPDSQIYDFFAPPIGANEQQGLWFDLVHIGGDPSDATLTIYSTDTGCQTLESLGMWSLASILNGGPEWKTECVTLRSSAPLSNIGFKFSGSQVDLGFESPRFGPACPVP